MLKYISVHSKLMKKGINFANIPPIHFQRNWGRAAFLLWFFIDVFEIQLCLKTR